MGTVIQVFFKPHANPNARSPFELIETDFKDLAEVFAATARDELIVGQQLFTHRGDEHNERIVHDAAPLGFRGGAVDRICLPTWKIVREID